MGIFDNLFKKKTNSVKSQKQAAPMQTTAPQNKTTFLTDFSHRPVPRNYATKAEAEKYAPTYLDIAKECTSIVNTTKDHRTFFLRYDMLIYYLIELKKMEGLVSFSDKSPSKFLNEVINTRDEQIRLFIHRRYETAKRNIETTDNKKVKLQQYDFYKKAMQEIDCELSENNRSEAAKLEEKLREFAEETKEETQKRLNDEVQAIELENAKELDTDLVEASYHRGCCGECAKYRGRWFSVSGKDKRFPKMPVDYGCTCSGLIFSPVIYGISEPAYCDTDIIEYSNRPFVDDRTEEEKANCDIEKRNAEADEMWSKYEKRWNAIREYDHKQYDRLAEELPDIAPKSYSGYMRMKKNNTKNYQKLFSEAASHGINLDYTDEIKCEIEELTPIHDEYAKVKAQYMKAHYNY